MATLGVIVSRIKNILQWLVILVPPFLLLPLATIPPDFVTSMFWAVGGFAFIASVINVIRIIIRKYQKHEIKYQKHIRPSLTIVVFIICVISIKSSLTSARVTSKATAQEILRICKTNGCPVTLTGWNEYPYSDDNYYKMVGGLAKYRLRYVLGDNLKTFSLNLRVNIDASYIYKEGDNGEIIEIYRCC